jgi:hypothetical protein
MLLLLLLLLLLCIRVLYSFYFVCIILLFLSFTRAYSVIGLWAVEFARKQTRIELKWIIITTTITKYNWDGLSVHDHSQDEQSWM